MLACVLPVCVIAGLLISYTFQQKRNLIEQRVLETARALSMVVDQQFAAMQAGATALATSPALASGDFATFYKQVKQLQQDNPSWGDVNLADASGQQYINSYVPFGTPLPKRHVSDVMRRVFEGKPGITNLFKGALTGRYVFAVRFRSSSRARSNTTWCLRCLPNACQQCFRSRAFHPIGRQRSWTVTLWWLPGTSREQGYIGIPAVPPLFKVASQAAEGHVESRNRAGVPIVAIFHRSAITGWTVAIGIPKAVMLAGLRQWMWWTVGGGLLLSSMGIALAMFLARRITTSIHALTGPALALGSGEPVNIGPLDLVEANELGQSLVKTSQLLQQRTAEREQLLQAAQRQAELQRLSFDAIVVWRLDAGAPGEPASGSPGQGGGIESWNLGAERLYGYSESEALGRVTHELLQSIHPKPWPEIELELRANGFWEGEIRHRTKDGREVIVWARRRFLRGDDGVERVLEANRDITDRKRTQEALQRQAELQRLSFDAIIFWRLDGGIESWNLGAEQLYGYSESEALGRVTHDLLQCTHPKPIEPELRANGFCEGEICQRTKQGDEVIVWTRKRLLRGDDGIERVLETNRDITAHRQAEQRVAHVASFPELNPNPIFEADPDGKISYANPAARKLFPHLLEYGADHPLLAELASAIAEFTTNPEQEIAREVEADGRTFLQTIHYRPELRRVRVYFTDITERKRAEATAPETQSHAPGPE